MSSTRIAEATRPALDRTGAAHPTDRRGLDRIAVGTRVGDFELLTELGAGAFARVFLARQRSMQRLVAVKVSADSGSEPQTLAQLDHDYIVRVFDQQVLDAPADGSPRLRLLYMQFLPGGTLLGVLRWVRATPPAERSGKLLLDAVDAAMEEKGEIRPADSAVRAQLARRSWPETVAWLGSRLAAALQHAAANGVLHRDVKPANVLLTAEGVPKLADFNISFSRSTGASPVSYFGGSLAYMSPEQLEACHPGYDHTAADLDTRADLYSLGVLLWELLTGAKPFDDTTVPLDELRPEIALDAALERRDDGITAAALAQVPADCPAALRRVLLTCLAADRADRWPDGGVLAAQFDLCLDARARDLVDPPPNSPRIRLRPYLFAVLALSIAIPNLLAALYNAQLNTALIVDRLDPGTRETLLTVAGMTNVLFFSVGAATLIYLARRLLIVPRRLRAGQWCSPGALDRARRDSLRFGTQAVAVAVVLWLSAAVVFAVTIALTGNGLTLRTAAQFLIAAAISAAIAMTYPFFLITLYLTRCVYPLFVHHGQDFRADGAALTGLITRCHRYLMTAASIPLLAVVSATFLPIPDLLMTTTPLRVICVGGALGFAGCYALFSVIEADIRALLRVVGTRPQPA
ncbi:serine/threonine-protein kinase [Nocardia sp. MW-W600-9]